MTVWHAVVIHCLFRVTKKFLLVTVTRRQKFLMVTVTRHQESLSGDGDMGVLPSFIANTHYVGILYLGDTVTRRQKRFWWWRWRGNKINPDGDGDAAPEIFWWWRWQQTYTMLGFYISWWRGDTVTRSCSLYYESACISPESIINIGFVIQYTYCFLIVSKNIDKY